MACNKLIGILLIVLVCNVASAQNKIIAKIDGIFKSIDSNIDSNKRIVRRIAEGDIFNKKKRIIGGWGDDYYTDSTRLLKVKSFTNYPKNITQEYYFQNDSLVFVKIKVEKYVGDYPKLLYTGFFYFHNNVVFFKRETAKNEYADADLLKNAVYYLDNNIKHIKLSEELRSGKFKQ